MATTGPQFPTINSGDWNNATNAYADDGLSAWCATGAVGEAGAQVHIYGGFGLSVPAGQNIDRVIITASVFDAVGDGSAINFDAQLRVSGVDKGDRLFVGEAAAGAQAPITTTPTPFQYDSVAGSWEPGDFPNLDTQIRGWANTTGEFVSLMYLTVEVEYSEESGIVDLHFVALAPELVHGPALSPELLERVALSPELAHGTPGEPVTAARSVGEPELGHGDADDPELAHGQPEAALTHGTAGTPTV